MANGDNERKATERTKRPPGASTLIFRSRMVEEQIVKRGVRNLAVLDAMRAIPREWFVAAELYDEAYEDRALPIGPDQTISQPFIVAYMTEQLGLSPAHRVLEIGTGSGYQTAVLARLSATVFSVERIAALRDQALNRLQVLGLNNVQLLVGDGSLGLPQHAPFDRIIVTAAAPRVPHRLVEQLGEGGRMIIPVGGPVEQTIVSVERSGLHTCEVPLLACRFVRLLGTEGWPEE